MYILTDNKSAHNDITHTHAKGEWHTHTHTHFWLIQEEIKGSATSRKRSVNYLGFWVGDMKHVNSCSEKAGKKEKESKKMREIAAH